MKKAGLREAYQLLHEGALCLADVEHAGIRVDTAYLDRTIKETAAKIALYEDKLKNHSLYKKWKKHFGDKAKLGSHEQLAKMVFGEYGLKQKMTKGLTATGKIKADIGAFEHIDHPFVRRYFELEKLRKVKGTYLEGIRREVVDGFLHPSYNTHLAQNFRLSCHNPNFQNMPIRDPEQGEVIRRCFIARDGHRLPEKDYVGIEVKTTACYHRDPTMLRYIKDKTTDMHRDMAAQLYMLPPDQVPKMVRFAAKSFFVFAEFYGDYYIRCAKSLWDAIDRLKGMATADGVSLKKHLAKKGIRECGPCDPEQDARPGTFEYHVKKVEQDFWGRRFPVYAAWKKSFYEKYQRRGFFDTFTGFRISGYHKRNEIINYGASCDASQCTLKSMILLNNWRKKYKLKSRVVGIIHDSILSDVHERELQDYLGKAEEIMTRTIPRLWPWIIVPLEVEVEIPPAGGSWFDKRPWVNKAGVWSEVVK